MRGVQVIVPKEQGTVDQGLLVGGKVKCVEGGMALVEVEGPGSAFGAEGCQSRGVQYFLNFLGDTHDQRAAWTRSR